MCWSREERLLLEQEREKQEQPVFVSDEHAEAEEREPVDAPERELVEV